MTNSIGIARRSALALVLSCLAATLLLAMTVVGSSRADRLLPLYIASVKPGMRAGKVRATLGRPRRITARRVGGMVFEREWHYIHRLTVVFYVERGRLLQVSRVRTESPRDRFSYGIHVGAKQSALNSLGGVECRSIPGKGGPWPRGYICDWRPPWVSNPCGPHLIFFMRHRHRRIKAIELDGIPGPDEPHPQGRIVPLDGCF